MANGVSARRYSAVAILLHWASALAVLVLIGLGLTMTHAALAPLRQFQLYQWHKSVGVTVLALTVLRLLWRLTHRPPPHPVGMPARERRAAAAAHHLLYLLLVGLPLTGWAVVSLSPFNIPTVLYGLVPWPHLPLAAHVPDPAAAEGLLKQVHALGAWFLAALLAVHVAAALRHHFLLRDDVLRRMLPGRRPSTAPIVEPTR
ncbi:MULTISPECIES: cytochrome b [Methylobacterium]|uniref:Cytochrome b561 n=1 Tax=Methylobacterium fujisawaense TaxID=107400 RepID=A0ABR6DEW2_9HYPH|nr:MULTISPECIES: cytochrome b [Methylobacterium]AWV15690.1 cytochrome B [Methylobacterium sp. XJLW]MBA9064448.1 cytochrome b561 [Methylobacterium fujisawaense]MDH3030265.1 cytochrome b [Methylobacterium fujisawaense]WFS06700.1 cytochrome b [Methylobacterium sp. 391_Methyba4]SFV05709.1 cytochrome b561 [Methylobacterium sp. UNCCL125]